MCGVLNDSQQVLRTYLGGNREFLKVCKQIRMAWVSKSLQRGSWTPWNVHICCRYGHPSGEKVQNSNELPKDFHEPKILTVGMINWNGKKAQGPEELEETMEIVCSNPIRPELRKVRFPISEQRMNQKYTSVGPIRLVSSSAHIQELAVVKCVSNNSLSNGMDFPVILVLQSQAPIIHPHFWGTAQIFA